METQNYFDFEIDLDKTSSIEDAFFLNDLKSRKLFINADIDQFTLCDVIRYIMQYNADDKGIPVEERKPILLYIVSNGGEVDTGFELIDVINTSKTPVYTINLGYSYSMGFLIGISGHRRYAMPTAKFLMHDGSSFVYNSSSKVQDQMKFQTAVEARIRDYILYKSKLTSEEYDSKLRVEWYMFADEAKQRGFIDYIIGEDCEIDEVV